MSLLSRVLYGQGSGQNTAVAVVKQHLHTSFQRSSVKQAITAPVGGAVCQQQQQLWKLARQIACSATAATFATSQCLDNPTVSDVLHRFTCLSALSWSEDINGVLVLQLPVQLGLSARLFSSASQADKQPAQQQPKKEVRLQACSSCRAIPAQRSWLCQQLECQHDVLLLSCGSGGMPRLHDRDGGPLSSLHAGQPLTGLGLVFAARAAGSKLAMQCNSALW